jgi:hypothetical protein
VTENARLSESTHGNNPQFFSSILAVKPGVFGDSTTTMGSYAALKRPQPHHFVLLIDRDERLILAIDLSFIAIRTVKPGH